MALQLSKVPGAIEARICPGEEQARTYVGGNIIDLKSCGIVSGSVLAIVYVKQTYLISTPLAICLHREKQKLACSIF